MRVLAIVALALLLASCQGERIKQGRPAGTAPKHWIAHLAKLSMRTWPRKVRDYDSRAAKLAQARALNDIRRHLDRNERRALIEAGLKAKK